ncbi:MAG: hypothetical protein RL095_2207 [Verrucomicrobiota bacterium]|jgi:hypothetical protein
MSPLLSPELLRRAAAGELEALAELDRMGFLMAPAESPADFVKRLKAFELRLGEFETEIAAKGEVEIEGLKLRHDGRIPQDQVDAVAAETQALYGFSISWVPGFYTDAGLLFGGFAMAWPPDLFSVFVLRPALKDRPRWLIYSRDEILAHELCHVARTPLAAITYEETFAYGTARSAFRRASGGALRSVVDTYVLVGLFVLCIGIQTWNTVMVPIKPGDPIFPPSVLVGLTLPILWIAWLALRQFLSVRRLKRLSASLAACCEQPRHLLFRLNDAEIIGLAASPPKSRDELRAGLLKLGSSTVRTELICQRCR